MPDRPIDPCAVRCTSVAEGLACCLAAHGRGAPATVTEQTEGCSITSTFDPSAWWSREAARCAAQVYGMVPEAGPSGVYLWVCGDPSRAEWRARSVHERRPCGGEHSLVYGLRADDGAFATAMDVHADGLCLGGSGM